jgi:putative endonuclease
MTPAARGALAETLCALVLRGKFYRILARRHVTGRGSGAGEIDIVARKGGTLVFVEVKARADLATAAGAISARQRRRLLRAAGAFLTRRPELAGLALRFDAMLVAPWRLPHHVIDAWREEG